MAASRFEKMGVCQGTPRFFVYVAVLLGEIGINQLRERCNSRFLIRAVSNNGDGGALYDAQRQNAQKALGVDTPLFLLDPDAALELIGFLNEERRGSGVKAHLIVDNYFLGNHARISLNLYENPLWILYYSIKKTSERQLLSALS
jgi:hypothetical protein